MGNAAQDLFQLALISLSVSKHMKHELNSGHPTKDEFAACDQGFVVRFDDGHGRKANQRFFEVFTLTNSLTRKRTGAQVRVGVYEAGSFKDSQRLYPIPRSLARFFPSTSSLSPAEGMALAILARSRSKSLPGQSVPMTSWPAPTAR